MKGISIYYSVKFSCYRFRSVDSENSRNYIIICMLLRINLTNGPSVVGRKIKPPNQNPTKTTTIILSSDENLNSPMLVDIEPETYFTRTGVHHHFQSLEDESQSDTSLLVQIDDQHLS